VCWPRSKVAKNRRICSSMRATLDTIDREHKYEHKVLRFEEQKLRSDKEKAQAQAHRAEVSAMNMARVGDTLRKRDEQVIRGARPQLPKQRLANLVSHGCARRFID
jgi:hypothetical protein